MRWSNGRVRYFEADTVRCRFHRTEVTSLGGHDRRAKVGINTEPTGSQGDGGRYSRPSVVGHVCLADGALPTCLQPSSADMLQRRCLGNSGHADAFEVVTNRSCCPQRPMARTSLWRSQRNCPSRPSAMRGVGVAYWHGDVMTVMHTAVRTGG